MTIESGKVVAIDYTLKDDDDQLIDTSEGRGPLSYLHGHGNIVKGLEEALEGKQTGETLEVTVSPDKGYGNRDESRIFEVPRDRFEGVDEINPGMQFQARTQQGVQLLKVVEADEEKVKVDANHPLAGANLNFTVDVKDIRDATDEEIQHGHVHGQGE